MPSLPAFEVEKWMDAHEGSADYQLAETCCASVSVAELIKISEDKITTANDILDINRPQTYGEINGHSGLRQTIADIYAAEGPDKMGLDDVLITPGAIAANTIAALSLVTEGDHVICQYPTYQQLYSVPQSTGAHVDFWKSREENGWLPDLDELANMITPATKLIVLNNPQNPTGTLLSKSILQKVVDLARPNNIIIHCDEVYRPLFHGLPENDEGPPSILSFGYNNVLATSSLSKAYSLAGIRVGWIASRNPEIVEKCSTVRDYTTISVSHLDQCVALYALSPLTRPNLLARNLQLAKDNVEILDSFVKKHDGVLAWTRPVAGTTALIKVSREGKPVDSEKFCLSLQSKTGVMLLPADRGFGQEFKGYVRIGYVNETKVLTEGLQQWEKFLENDFSELPLSQ
ncbi:hypothetical protein Q7P37_002263 [Cladosporium fusiforme]